MPNRQISRRHADCWGGEILERVAQRGLTSPSCSKPDQTGPEQHKLVEPAVNGLGLDGKELVTRCFQMKHLIGSQYTRISLTIYNPMTKVWK